MRIVLLGDSHLARIRRDLMRLTPDLGGTAPSQVQILNAAVGGAFVSDLSAQVVDAGVRPSDHLAVSIGTNEAAPWKHVDLDTALRQLQTFLSSCQPQRLVYLVPPGVDEARLNGPNDRTSAAVARYAEAFSRVFLDAGARLVDGPGLVAPLGAGAFVADGVHLSGRGYDAILPALREALLP